MPAETHYSHRMNKRSLVPIAAVLFLAGQSTFATALFVTNGGNDQNSGTRTSPFATVERARDEIRRIKNQEPLPAGGITVELGGGVYELARALEWTAQDSGTESSRIVYRARQGEAVRIVCGRLLTTWERVNAPTVLARMNPPANGKVFQVDLKAAGVTDLQGINNAGVYQSDPGLELFFQDQPMTLARYPNSGYLHIADVLDGGGIAKSGQARTADGKFVCADPRFARWIEEKEVWPHGFWMWDWADQRVPLGTIDLAAHTVSLTPRPG